MKKTSGRSVYPDKHENRESGRHNRRPYTAISIPAYAYGCARVGRSPSPRGRPERRMPPEGVPPPFSSWQPFETRSNSVFGSKLENVVGGASNRDSAALSGGHAQTSKYSREPLPVADPSGCCTHQASGDESLLTIIIFFFTFAFFFILFYFLFHFIFIPCTRFANTTNSTSN